MKNFSLNSLVLTASLCFSGLLLGAPQVHAASPELSTTMPAQIDSNGCDLPAPSSFYVTATGIDFISVTWTPVQFAQAYFLKAVYANTSIIVDSFTVSGTVTHATYHVPIGGSYDLIIAAVAEDCPPSSRVAIIEDVTLIVDLIATGKTLPANTVQVPVEGCLTEQMGNEDYWFKIFQYGNLIGIYSIDRLPPQSSGPVSCLTNLLVAVGKVDIGFTITDAYIHTDNYDFPACAEGENVRIKMYGAPASNLFDLKFEGTTNQIFKLCVDRLAGREFSYMLCREVPPIPGDRSPGSSNAAALSIPNPFTGDLRIQTPEPPPGPVHFRLFNLNGTSVLEQQFPASQEYNLPTAGLPPGFYLLRMESGGLSRTYKVVKAQ